VATGDFKNGTALTGGILGQPQLGTSATNLLAASPVAANTYVTLKKVIFTNTSASPVTITYGAVKSGGTLGDATCAAKTWPLGAAGTTTATVDATELAGMILGPGDFLAGLASTGAVVTATVSGATSA